MEKLKAFWTFISTPGTQMPASTTIIILALVAAFIFLMPHFAQWRAYRRANSQQSPADKLKAKAAANVGRKNKSKTSSKKKKKH